MLTAIRDNIFVKLDEVKKEKSLLVLMDDPTPVTAVVVSCGPGVHSDSGNFVPMIVEVGDRVLFANNALNYPVMHEGVQLYAMKPEHIYGIIK